MNITELISKGWDKLTSSTYSIYSKQSDGSNKIWLEFDVIDECSFSGSSTVTKYPAEIGVVITDYKYTNPDSLTIKGVVMKNGTFGLGALGINYSLFGKDKNSLIERIRAQCDKLVRSLQLVNIQTRNSGLRENFTLTSYTIEENPDNYNLLEVDMSFEEVLLFGRSGQLTRSISDHDTQDGGIVQTLSSAIKDWWNNEQNSD